MTCDDYVTLVTDAPDQDAALAVLAPCTMRMLWEIADLIYVDPYGMGHRALRRAIVAEVRA